MLSREERRRFNDIAQALTAEDPRFGAGIRTAKSGRRFSAVRVLCALLYISPLLMLVFGWPVAGIIAALFVLVVLWFRWFRRS
jgi:hypothetical protein